MQQFVAALARRAYALDQHVWRLRLQCGYACSHGLERARDRGPAALRSAAVVMKLHDEVSEDELAERNAIAATLHGWVHDRTSPERPSLRSFLQWATENVPFYQRWRERERSISRLPLTSRSLIARRQDDFVAAPMRLLPDLFGRETSGTTGRPLFVRFDPACWYDYQYTSHVAFMRACPEALARVRRGRVAIVLVTDKPQAVRLSAPLPDFDGARFRQLVIGRSAREDAAVVRALRSQSPPLLHGVAVTLVRLAELDAAIPGGRIEPGGIVTSGTNLFDDDRTYLERWFRCRVVNAYASTEGGLIAIECPHRTGLHVRATRRLEVLRPDGRVTSSGTGEIVLTNMKNHATIFLRYRTGDIATIVARQHCQCGHRGATIVDLPAREATRLGRRHVPTAIIDSALRPLGLRRFQLAQLSPERFRFRWEPHPGVTYEPREIRRVLNDVLGPIRLAMRSARPLFGPGEKHGRFVVHNGR